MVGQNNDFRIYAIGNHEIDGNLAISCRLKDRLRLSKLTSPMDDSPYLLVTQYDGGRFAGWQRQPVARTVQGEMERSLTRLCGERVPVLGAGRTDAGVHAHGQGAGIRLPARWDAASIRRAMNALLPDDIWICEAHRMTADFHVRRSAISRRYDYLVGTDEASQSPFRRRFEWPLARKLDSSALHEEAQALIGEHSFRAFAVSGTAPAHDHHRCIITRATWRERDDGSWLFEIEANRFLHHMVRFLVGTMVSVAQGRRAKGTVPRLLALSHNSETSPPAPAVGLSLRAVSYPSELYATGDGESQPASYANTDADLPSSAAGRRT